MANILATSNANPSYSNLSEAGVHKMYISYESEKAEAIQFQNWVFDEALPQIGKTGRYVTKYYSSRTKAWRSSYLKF